LNTTENVKTIYAGQKRFKSMIRKPSYYNSTPLGPRDKPESFWEFELKPAEKSYKSATVQLGLTILNLAKVRLLDFYWSFLDKFLRPGCFCPAFVDTGNN